MKNLKNNIRVATVRVSTNSRKPRIEATAPGCLHVWVSEKAKDNEANDAVVNSISKYFNVSRTSVRIVRGKKSRIKILEITE